MPDKPWKRAERNVATRLGGVRTPLSGKSSKHTSGDVIHPTLYVEVKYRQQFAIVSTMEEVSKKAHKEGKIPVLALVSKSKKTRHYLIPEKLMTILMTYLPVAVKLTASDALPDNLSHTRTRQQEPL